MKTTLVLKTVSVLLVGGLSLAAQDTQWQANAGLALPVGSANSMMGLSAGLQIGGAYEIKTTSGYAFRPGVNFTFFGNSAKSGVVSDADSIVLSNGEGTAAQAMPYNTPETVKQGLSGFQFVTDFLVPIYGKSNFLVGLSLNKYSEKMSGGRAAGTNGANDMGVYSPVGIDSATYLFDGTSETRMGNPNGSASVPGVKWGIRVGFESECTKNWSYHIIFQQTELGRMTSNASALPDVNPAWFEIGATYKF